MVHTLRATPNYLGKAIEYRIIGWTAAAAAVDLGMYDTWVKTSCLGNSIRLTDVSQNIIWVLQGITMISDLIVA